MTLRVQRGEHNIEDELVFSKHTGYIFHDSCGLESGKDEELKIVQDFVGRRSRERQLNDRLHAIWFAPKFSVSVNCTFTKFPFQVLRSDG
jgi:hypothetical protein